jgi:hypothetical protein
MGVKSITFKHIFVIKIFFLILFFHSNCFAKIKFLDWQEYSTVNTFGKTSRHKMLLKVVDLPPDYTTSSFSITSNSQDVSSIYNLKVDGKNAQYTYQNNHLEITFPQKKKNNETIAIEYDFKQKYSKFNKYLNDVAIYLPEFASGARAKVVINFAPDFRLISIHNNIIIEENKIIYQGIVPQNGLQENLRFTNKKVAWDVEISNSINTNNATGTLKVIAPYVFRGGAQEVQDQTIATSMLPNEHLTTKENNMITFQLKPSLDKITITNKATIITGDKYFIKNNSPQQNYLEISEAEQQLLLPILQQIIVDEKYENLPLYAKIGRYVHDYITYDISYFSKLLSVSEILQEKKGVCAEYATLFNALARTAGIPSSIVYGYAYGDYNKFESHAWNMIYHDNHWFYVDPTWNLLAGSVSSSHIYVQDNRGDDLKIEYRGFDNPKFIFDKKFNIKEIYAFN